MGCFLPELFERFIFVSSVGVRVAVGLESTATRTTWQDTHLSTFARRPARRSDQGEGHVADGLQLLVHGAAGDVVEHEGQHLVVVGQAAGGAFFVGHQVARDGVLVDVADAEHRREFRHHDDLGLGDPFRGGHAGLDGRELERAVLGVLADEHQLRRRAEEVRDRADGLDLVGDHRRDLVDVAEDRGVGVLLEADGDLAAGVVGDEGVGRGERVVGGEGERDRQGDHLQLGVDVHGTLLPC